MKRPHLIVLLGITAASMSYIAMGLPGLASRVGWFYQPMERGLGEALPLAIGAVGAVALTWIGVAAAGRRHFGRTLLSLMVASLVAQVALVLADAHGPDAAFRWQWQGHGEIAQTAHRERDRWSAALGDYEARVRAKALGAFTPSKPPGALGAYMAVDALAEASEADRWLGFLSERAAEHPEIGERADTAAFAFVLFPLLTTLAIPLTFFLGRALFCDAWVALGGSVLVAFSPAVLLIQQHLDGAIYPSLALLPCLLSVLGARRGAPWWSGLSGVVFGLSLYISFSLLPVVGLVGACLVFVAAERAQRVGGTGATWRAGWHLAAFFGGTVLSLWLLYEVASYHFADRLVHALDYHAEWKRGVPTGAWRGLALAEFALYLSFPLAIALAWRASVAGVRLSTERFRAIELAPIGMLAFVLVLSAVSGTNEVARLWLFVVPFVALAAALGLPETRMGSAGFAPIGWLAGCQAVVAVVLKANQMW